MYEEAPIAYVKEDLESRFLGANRAALRILGIKPEEVPGMVGMSLVPDTFGRRHSVRFSLSNEESRRQPCRRTGWTGVSRQAEE